MSELNTDKKDIQRGAMVNFVGYGLKLASPLLLIVVARRYGADVLGNFLAMQALILVLNRAVCLGLDKGVLWWVAKESESVQDSKQTWQPVWNVFVSLAILSLFVTILFSVGAKEYLEWKGESSDLSQVFRIMIWGLCPAVLTDILLHSLMGKKKMGPQVFIKETFVSVAMVVLAILFFILFADNDGLAWGYMVAQWLGLGVTIYFFNASWSFSWKALDKSISFPDKKLFRYSFPLWVAEVGNSFLQRMDVFALTYFVKTGVVPLPGAVGIYGIVAQFANAVRSIRRSFDPIVLAIVSGISTSKNIIRLREGLNHSSFLVSATQLPIFAFFFCFGDWVLLIYGQEFLQGAFAIWILSFFWVINGTLGLCGIVVLGYGYSYFSLLNVIFAMLVKAVLLYIFVPLWGLEGAAFSVGAAYTAQGLAQFIQMRIVTGGYHFRIKAFIPIFWGGAGGALALITYYTIDSLQTAYFEVLHASQIAAFVSFLVVYGLGMWKLYKKEKSLKV